jgi:hypothetical protein
MASVNSGLMAAMTGAVGAPAIQGRAWDAGQAAALLQAGFDINSLMAGWVDRGAWLYYDRLYQQPLQNVGNGAGVLAQTYSAFSVGINKPDAITGVNKTLNYTNMPNSGQFNPPRCMVMRRLGFYFEPDMALADIELFMKNASLQFVIDSKVFFEGLIEFFPGGMGITGATSQTGTAVWSNGFPTPHAMRDYGDYAKYIAPLQNFSLTINFPSVSTFQGAGGSSATAPTLSTTGTGLNVVCIMDGLTDRSVQ